MKKFPSDKIYEVLNAGTIRDVGVSTESHVLLNMECIMKNVSRMILSVLTTVAVAACGHGGGSASTPGVGVAGSCATDASGTCVGGISNITQFYPAGATWTGVLTVVNSQMFQQMMQEQRLCSAFASPYSCIRSGVLNVTVRFNDGQLPGSTSFMIQTSINGRWSNYIRQTAQGYVPASNNGFILSYTSYAYGMGGYGMGGGYPSWNPYNGTTNNGYYVNTTANNNLTQSLQIVGSWTDNSENSLHTLANTNIVYRGVVVATGMLHAPMNTGMGGSIYGTNYNPAMGGSYYSNSPYYGQQPYQYNNGLPFGYQ